MLVMVAIAFPALFSSALLPAFEGISELLVAADRQEPRVAIALLLGAASMRFFVSVFFHFLGAGERQ
ncbi:MAG: hypothetical protein AAFX40_18870 [Cyanobacteria bacterium J06639_1]